MTNQTTTSRRQTVIAVALILAGLSILLIPGVPAEVATVPQTVGSAFSTIFSWLF